MTRSAARRLAPAVVVALALLAGGCSSDDSTDTTAGSSPAASSVSAELCSSFASLKADAADLSATKIDTTGSADQVQQQVADLENKAQKVNDDLQTLLRVSQGGPVAAVIGTLNQKADALRAQLTEAKANAQSDLGPKITAAQAEVTTALEPVTAAVGKLCPSS